MMAVSLTLLPLYSPVLICKDARWTPRSRRTFGFKSWGLLPCYWTAAPDASQGRSAFIASHQSCSSLKTEALRSFHIPQDPSVTPLTEPQISQVKYTVTFLYYTFSVQKIYTKGDFITHKSHTCV
jgi:hypothetical protein